MHTYAHRQTNTYQSSKLFCKHSKQSHKQYHFCKPVDHRTKQSIANMNTHKQTKLITLSHHDKLIEWVASISTHVQITSSSKTHLHRKHIFAKHLHRISSASSSTDLFIASIFIEMAFHKTSLHQKASSQKNIIALSNHRETHFAKHVAISKWLLLVKILF